MLLFLKKSLLVFVYFIFIPFTTHSLAILNYFLSKLHAETVCVVCLAASFALKHCPGPVQPRLPLGLGVCLWSFNVVTLKEKDVVCCGPNQN